MDNRKLIYILAGLLLVITAAFGWSLTRGSDEKAEEGPIETAAKQRDVPAKDPCASTTTYARLKHLAFEEAAKLRASDTANLDTLAAQAVVRMENPVVQSRDEDLNVTVCSGRFILELPPGAETAFGGARRLTADIEYAAQAAADGSGLVYQLRGADPIISKLAAFNLGGPGVQAADAVQPSTGFDEAATTAVPPATPETPETEAEVDAPPAPTRRALPQAPFRPRASDPIRLPPSELGAGRYSNPSFNCRSARTRGERAVCASQPLAARDRAMSSMFNSAMDSADAPRRAALRRTRDRFLAYRDRCRDDACIADAYEGRMREIRDIMEME